MAKVALITGSTSGIGLGIARALASKGRSIILTGFGSEELIEKHRTEIESTYNVPATYLSGDLSRDDDVIGLCNKIHSQHPGGVDILVNNAGFQYVSRVEEFPLDKWNNMISVMLTAPFLLTQNLLPGMRTKGWGRIINISSVHGHVASLNKIAYVTAKHGIQGFTKVVALETARSGVTCNALCPGWVQTELFEKQVDEISEQRGISWQDAKEVLLEKHPSKECTTMEQVGEAVNFICSSACDNMTGSSMVLDGGWTAV
ncbi:D-beta-hydroxybutyrate dehydrogenase-like [Lytechinus variegatus]|uniref:D-beta-hydroxybutyrate dehydrogenase-like n=1 Tax=Lytechinus variegatus TaxID=7654 RepID=UPI001BB1FF78|nr:D-beta-hydroxybutyrate dehydrogenase-like [Lytechinus variegatus]XP_041480195.1 D-beta-hydroxybutyrate dehydrogenase-like [Lytechinus variegatus]